MVEELRNQMIYLASVDMLRRMLKDKKFDKKVLDRLNRKNAETMNVKVVEL